MEKSDSICVDLINRRTVDEAFVLVLVEDGPWAEEEVLERLKKLQNRLASTVEAVTSGSFARQFPGSLGKHFVIRLNSYNIRSEELDVFYTRFTDWIKKSEKVARGVDAGHIRSLHFEYIKF